MGQRDIRRLLIIGDMAVIQWASRHGARPGSWLGRMLDRKPLMLVAMALADKIGSLYMGDADKEGGLSGSWQRSSLNR